MRATTDRIRFQITTPVGTPREKKLAILRRRFLKHAPKIKNCFYVVSFAFEDHEERHWAARMSDALAMIDAMVACRKFEIDRVLQHHKPPISENEIIYVELTPIEE